MARRAVRTPRGVRIRHVVVIAICGLMVALGTGPVRATLLDTGVIESSSLTPEQAEESSAARQAATSRPGIWDTTAVAHRPLPTVTKLSPEESVRLRPDPDRHVVLTGTLTGEVGSRVLPGVGVVVTRRDRERLATRGEVPAAVEALQQVTPYKLKRRGGKAVRGTRPDLEAIVTQEIGPRITARSGLVAGRVLTDLNGPGLLEPQGPGLGLTTRGMAYLVTARAVPPGSRTVEVTTMASRLSVLAFAHGEAGGSVLIHNTDSSARLLVVDLLVEGLVHRYEVRVAPRSLTSMVLA